MSQYTISVKQPAADQPVIVEGTGDRKVMYYLAGVGQNALEVLPEDTEVSVTLFEGDHKHLNFTGDAADAAGLIKARVLKIRRAVAATAGEPTAE